jgi:hypothetical protein
VRWLAAVAILSSLIGVSCTDNGPTKIAEAPPAGPHGMANPSSCAGALKDGFFDGEGEVVLAAESGGRTSCTLGFSGASAILPKLGLRNVCPDDASIVVAIDITGSRWTYNATETRTLDNGDCIGA